MSRDLALHVGSKLSGEWSTIPGMLSEEVVDYLITKWASLEPLVRTRLLLSPLLLKRRDLTDLRPALARLAAAGRADKDEWVRVTAQSVGDYEGWLHTGKLARDFKLVSTTLADLGRLLDAADPAPFRPQEEVYLDPEVLSRLRGQAPSVPTHHHFRPRPAAEAPSQHAAAAPGSAAVQAGGPSAARAPSPLPVPTAGAARAARQAAGGLFLESKPPARGPLGPCGVGSLSVLDRRTGDKVKRTATLDLTTVQQLTKQQQEEQRRRAQEEQEGRDAEARARAEARNAERAARDAAKEAEVRARMEAKLAQRAQREAEKQAERAQREAERQAERSGRASKDVAERVAQTADRQAERVAKAAEKAARGAEREAERAAKLKRKRSLGAEDGGPAGKPARPGADPPPEQQQQQQQRAYAPLAPPEVYSADAAAAALGDAALYAAAEGAGLQLGQGGVEDLAVEGMQAYLQAAYGGATYSSSSDEGEPPDI